MLKEISYVLVIFSRLQCTEDIEEMLKLRFTRVFSRAF